jgi:hypothetical protein
MTTRGTYQQSPRELAAWVLRHGCARLGRRERVFLFGITIKEVREGIDPTETAEIYRIFRKVAKRQEKTNA